VAGVLKGGADGDKRTLHLQALLWNSAAQQFESKNCAHYHARVFLHAAR
jgi:hypothetical protein